MIYRTTYSAIKMYAAERGLKLKWLDEESGYFITLTDGQLVYQTYLAKIGNSDDLQDFENNIKPLGADTTVQADPDGAQVVRVKAAKKGWTFCALPFEFETAQIGSLYSKEQNGNLRSWITLKFYDPNGQEITNEGLLQINESTVIRSIVDFEPPYDYELIGGTLRIEQGVSSVQNCRLWIIAAPDIPASMGGSKEMAGGVNLRYLAPENEFAVDGRVSKVLTYNSMLHTNKLRFIFEHTAGLKVSVQVVVELYRA